MARTIAEIQLQIITDVENDATLGPNLTSTSVTAVWRIWTFVVASAIWALEVLYDLFKVEVSEIVASQKAHTLRWYQAKALAYQFGGVLNQGDDTYNNTGLSDDSIAAQKVVSRAAAVEQNDQVVVKVAKFSGSDLVPLSSTQITGITAYFQQIKDAGVKVLIRSVNADKLKLTVDVYYDATILDETGARLDGTDTEPVQKAIRSYLLNLPFDGLFTKSLLTDAMQAVEGIKVPEIRMCMTRRYDDPSFASVDIYYQPYSGFLRIYDESTELELNFIAS